MKKAIVYARGVGNVAEALFQGLAGGQVGTRTKDLLNICHFSCIFTTRGALSFCGDVYLLKLPAFGNTDLAGSSRFDVNVYELEILKEDSGKPVALTTFLTPVL